MKKGPHRPLLPARHCASVGCSDRDNSFKELCWHSSGFCVPQKVGLHSSCQTLQQWQGQTVWNIWCTHLLQLLGTDSSLSGNKQIVKEKAEYMRLETEWTVLRRVRSSNICRTMLYMFYHSVWPRSLFMCQCAGAAGWRQLIKDDEEGWFCPGNGTRLCCMCV